MRVCGRWQVRYEVRKCGKSGVTASAGVRAAGDRARMGRIRVAGELKCGSGHRAAGELAHRARSRTCRWRWPPCHVEDMPLVLAHRVRSRTCRWCQPRCRVEDVSLVLATLPRQGRVAGADHRAASRTCRWCRPRCPGLSRAAGADHRATSKPCRWCRPPCRVEDVSLVPDRKSVV